MQTIPFGEWTPDAAKLGAGLRQAKGVVPTGGGAYGPLADLKTYNTLAQTAGPCLGAASFYTNATGSHLQIFMGDASNLYRLVNKAATTYTRAAGGYKVDPDWMWSFEQFGDYIYAGTRGVPLQFYSFGQTQQEFADVPGEDTPRTCDALFRVRASMLVGSGRTLKWSAFNDPQSWTPSLALQSGETELSAAAGLIMAGVGGEQGTIFQERGIVRLSYVGPPTTWTLDEVEIGRGLIGPKALCAIGRQILYVAQDGFWMFDGLQSQSVGNQKVDKYFTSRLNYGFRHKVCCALDAARKAVLILFPSGSSQVPNEALIWSYADNRWTHDAFDAELAFNFGREGVSIDDTAEWIARYSTAVGDSLAVSADSPLFRESRSQWAIVEPSAHRIQTFEGSARAALVDAPEGELVPGSKARLTELWPVTDAPPKGVTVQVAARLGLQSQPQALLTASRVNLLTRSEDFIDAAWVKTAATAAAVGTLAPDGTASVDKLAETAATNVHGVRQVTTAPANVSHVLSVRVQAAERSEVGLILFDNADTGNRIEGVYDLTSRSAVASVAGVASQGEAYMRRLSDGWWLLWLTGIASGTAQVIRADIRVRAGGASSYLGVAGSGILVWGAQLEPGRYPKPYLITGAAAAQKTGAGPLDNGVCPVRADARYLQARIEIEAGLAWSEMSGVHHNGVASGVG